MRPRIAKLARETAAALAALCIGCAAAAEAAPRIVSLDQCADQYVLALAPRDQIVGLSKRARNADSYLRTDAAGLPERRATLESILGSRATIAVTYWAGDARLPAALARRGVSVIQIGEATDFAGVRADVRKVAAGLGRRAAGESLIAAMDAKLARSRGAWEGARALYLTPGGFTAGRATLVGAMLAGAGLISAGGSASYAPVTLEDLVLNPPAALVLGFFRDLANGGQRGTIAGNGYLRALAERRTIASLPGAILGCPAWFAADGSAALAAAKPR
ncbi:MAG TPA: ABC transporter substrate-binding protein [Caulobacteraceae bacterium]|nr:ABC transporter substrate-binding protein [Caulobacteraceae bacterium]